MASNFICSCQYVTTQNYGCNSAQNYCSPQPEGAVENLFRALNAPSVSRDDIIIKKVPQAELNRWIQYVKDADKYKGGTQTPGQNGTGASPSNTGASTAAEGRDFVYADKVNDLISDMIGLNGKNNPGKTFARDQVIYASDFQAIINKLNSLKLNHSGCPACVTGCNVTTCISNYYRAC